MIALAVLGALLAASPAPDSPVTLEARAAAHVVYEFERVGRRAPTADPVLDEAARRLAREALTDYPTGAPDLFTLTDAVSDSGGADPSPRTLVIRAATRPLALETFEAHADFNDERATHYGLGIALRDERVAVVLLLADRKAELLPFPRALPGDRASRVLCGRLAPSLREPELYVTRPGGEVERVSGVRATSSNRGFCAKLELDRPGTYTVEVVAKGDAGPEVAALFLTDLGPRRQREREQAKEPTTLPDARQAVYERINALRRAFKLPELAPDPTLEQVALGYSERMDREGFFAHVAPDGSSLTQRLPEGTRYVRAGENLGLAPGPLAAHFGIEHSPGHRKNLLDPAFRFVGVGVTFQKREGRDQVLLTEVFTAASPGAPASTDPLGDAYDALARQRAALKLPPLERSEALERIALRHAQRALELDQPSAQPSDVPLHERVFAALPDAGTAAVDFYVVGDPSALPDSRSLANATNNRVGVGLVRGDSKRYGRGQYWVAIIYAAVP